jgi:3-hydroxybutyryl-CoA dehydratase
LGGHCLEDLSIGQSAETSGPVTAADVEAFAAVSGDDNPLHLDEAFAAKTRFGGRIAHGMLVASRITAVLGARLPGPGSIYVSQTLRFLRPVRIGEIVAARVEVAAIDATRARVTLSTTCSVGGKKVVDGVAEVMVPRRVDSAAPEGGPTVA